MDEFKIWEKRKSDLLSSINATIEKGGDVDKETLELMKALVEKVKLRKRTMEDYFNDLD